jgi:hypothetical protein
MIFQIPSLHVMLSLVAGVMTEPKLLMCLTRSRALLDLGVLDSRQPLNI